LKTINSPSGPYITVKEQENTFSIQLHRSGNVSVVLDKKVIPELIEELNRYLVSGRAMVMGKDKE